MLRFGLFAASFALLALTGLSERFGIWVSLAVWALLWVIYLSYVNIGLTFYGFGWESMLLESGFLAIFLGAANTEPRAIMIWLLTRSTSVTISVTGCSTWMRVFISMK